MFKSYEDKDYYSEDKMFIVVPKIDTGLEFFIAVHITLMIFVISLIGVCHV